MEIKSNSACYMKWQEVRKGKKTFIYIYTLKKNMKHLESFAIAKLRQAAKQWYFASASTRPHRCRRRKLEASNSRRTEEINGLASHTGESYYSISIYIYMYVWYV